MASKRKAAAVLRFGAKQIEEYGWIQRAFGSRESGFCVLGSVHDHASTPDERNLAFKALRSFTGEPAIAWNDQTAKSKKEIVTTLRKAARALEHGLKVTV